MPGSEFLFRHYLETIFSSISSEMETYRQRFFLALEGESETLLEAISHISASEGKHLRPALLMLTAKCFGKVTDQLIDAAIFIEMLHTATLIHDDVVDDTDKRRGYPAMHTLIGNQAAVLVGDYLLSTSMYMAVKTGELRVLDLLMQLGRELSDGELYQLDMAKRGYPDEEKYFRIIRKKTGFLIASAMKIGAMLANDMDEELLDKIFEAGLLLGSAFQIRDDIFDYQEANSALGKPVGNDLREHKVTLPLIQALQKSPNAAPYRQLLEKDLLSDEDIHQLISFARDSGGLEYAYKKVDRLIEKAVAILEESLPESENRRALIDICYYIGKRKK